MDNKNKFFIFFAVIILVSSIYFITPITFDSNTYVEMVPAIKGIVCLVDNSENCVSGSNKEILIAMTFVYPSQDDSQRATPSVIPLVKFDGKMYRAVGGGVHNIEDPELESCRASCPNPDESGGEISESGSVISERDIYSSCMESCWSNYSHYDYSTGRMNTLNPDGSEIENTAQTKYTLDAKNAGLSNFFITIGSNTYKLNSVSTTKKITGVLSSDNFVSSDNLLTTKLSCASYDVDYAICNYNIIGSGDSQAFLDWGDGTSEEVFPSPYFIDIPKSHTYQQSGGTYDVILKLVSSSGQETITNTENLELVTPSGTGEKVTFPS